jgi:hypothetical protein
MANGTYIDRIVIGGDSAAFSGDLYTIGTATYAPPTGATSAEFTGIPKEPDYFVLYLDTVTVEQWHRVGVIMYDGEKLYGQSYFTGSDYECNFYENDKNPTGSYKWSFSYSNGTLTVSAQRTGDQDCYFHNPGTYTLRYAYKDEAGTVAIGKARATVPDNSTTVSFPSLAGQPVWFNALMLSNFDAQAANQASVTYADENGNFTMSIGSSPVIEYTRINGYTSYADGTFTLTRTGGAVFHREYLLIYAYVPQEQTGTDTVNNLIFNVMSAEKFEELQKAGGVNTNEFYLLTGAGSASSVISVNGQTGAVTITAADLGVDKMIYDEITEHDRSNSAAHQQLFNQKLDKTGGTMEGALVAQSNSNYTTRQVRNIISFTTGNSMPASQPGDLIVELEA